MIQGSIADDHDRRRYFEALSRLKHDAMFRVVMDAISARVSELCRDSRTLDGAPMYRRQGAASEWEGFLTEVERAEEYLRNFTA